MNGFDAPAQRSCRPWEYHPPGIHVYRDRADLGVCPECDAPVSPPDVIIEYERTDGRRAAYAECPACDAVVRPV